MIKNLFFSLVAPIALLVVLFSVDFAQTKQQIHFAKGSSSATVRGIVRSYDYVDYVVGARARQEMTVKLSSSNTFTVLTVFSQNGENLEGAAEQTEFSGELPESGNYVIRIYMMRNEARRKNSNARFTLKISIH
jgi:hypothetical protein